MSALHALFSAIGGLAASYYAMRFVRFLYANFLQPEVNLDYLRGSWAIVTGATSGIGNGFCHELARRGLNIVLISRSKTSLDECAKELETLYADVGVKTRVIVADFNAEEPLFDSVAEAVSDLDVSILVNNVGVNVRYPMPLLDTPQEDEARMLRVNCVTLTQMTRRILPLILKRKKGAVITVSSISAHAAVWGLGIYAGTKAFGNQLSLSLSMEYGKSHPGVHFLSILPGVTTSKMSRVRKPSLMICSERRLARDAVNRLGRDSWTSPYYVHAIQLFFFSFFDGWLGRYVLSNFAQSAARRAQKKIEEKNKEE